MDKLKEIESEMKRRNLPIKIFRKPCGTNRFNELLALCIKDAVRNTDPGSLLPEKRPTVLYLLFDHKASDIKYDVDIKDAINVNLIELNDGKYSTNIIKLLIDKYTTKDLYVAAIAIDSTKRFFSHTNSIFANSEVVTELSKLSQKYNVKIMITEQERRK